MQINLALTSLQFYNMLNEPEGNPFYGIVNLPWQIDGKGLALVLPSSSSDEPKGTATTRGVYEYLDFHMLFDVGPLGLATLLEEWGKVVKERGLPEDIQIDSEINKEMLKILYATIHTNLRWIAPRSLLKNRSGVRLINTKLTETTKILGSIYALSEDKTLVINLDKVELGNFNPNYVFPSMIHPSFGIGGQRDLDTLKVALLQIEDKGYLKRY